MDRENKHHFSDGRKHKLAKERMLFTDYYSEASCTAGRANFITGELPIRTGMTTVGQAGASVGLPAELVWLNPTRMHTVTHLSLKYEALQNAENGWSEEEGGMVQLDDDVGIVMDKLRTMGEDETTIVVFTTDNGKGPSARHEIFYLGESTVGEGGSQAPHCKPPAKDEDSHAV